MLPLACLRGPTVVAVGVILSGSWVLALCYFGRFQLLRMSRRTCGTMLVGIAVAMVIV